MTDRRLFIVRQGLLCIFLSILCGKSIAQNELPSAVVAQNQTITLGSLIIPMDTILQNKPGYFNLKAYGLINALLQNEIPVKWAIKKGKAKNNAASADFTTASSGFTRVFPDTQVIASATSFYSGPFIIDSNWVSAAIPIIKSFGNNVVVVKLNANTILDIRYTLTFKPLIGLLNSNGYDTVTVHELQEAGFYSWSYKLFMPAGQIFNQSSTYSLLSDAHYTGGDTTHVNPVIRYVQYGSNFMSHCTGIGAYENNAKIMSTGGFDTATSVSSYIFSNNDLPIGQFQGTLFNPWGEYKWWKLKAGSSFNTSIAYDVVTRGASARVLNGAKLKPAAEKGGNIYYLCGHDFYFYTASPFTPNDITKINGRRIFLNAVFVPPADTIGLDFRTDIQLKMSTCSGFPVKNEAFTFYVAIKNVGYRAKNIKVQVPLPVGLSYLSHTVPKGVFNAITGVWNIDSVMRGESDTLKLTVIINQLGTITYYGTAVNGSLEYVNANNTDSVTIFAVSRPKAVNDTNTFIGPYFVDTDTRKNDTDEDGGPFGNNSIINGPFNGTASVTDSNFIRYSPNPAFIGSDSVQYLTCDNYPLCDTAWLFINVSTPLPVKLSYFTGSRRDGIVNLRWTTLSESDNDYFNIEKSTDGKRFEISGKVKGSGTSNMIHHYDFKEADTGEPLLYYRLRQVDYNGVFEMSPILALPLKSKGKLSLGLYPNPVSRENELAIHIEGLKEGEDLLRISDLTGRVIFEKSIEPESGTTADEFLKTNSYLESGCYIITVISRSEVIGARLIVK